MSSFFHWAQFGDSSIFIGYINGSFHFVAVILHSWNVQQIVYQFTCLGLFAVWGYYEWSWYGYSGTSPSKDMFLFGGWGKNLEEELLCHLVSVCWLYREVPCCFSDSCTILHSHQKCLRDPLLHILTNTCHGPSQSLILAILMDV